MSEMLTMLRLDALDAGDLRVFVTQTAEQRIAASLNAEIRDGGVLRSVCGYGETFAEALQDLWSQLAELDDSKLYVVINAMRAGRRAVRWNGAAWKPVCETDRTTGDA